MLFLFRPLHRSLRYLFLAAVCLSSMQLSAQAVPNAAGEDPDRPVLKRQPAGTKPQWREVPEDLGSDPVADAKLPAGTGPVVAPGIVLPGRGSVWALDAVGGKPGLVRLKYVLPRVNNHTAANTVKTNLLPVFYKPKSTVEIQGAKAVTRLHEQSIHVYVRNLLQTDDAAAEASHEDTIVRWAIVKAKVKKDRRVVSTIEFTYFTGKPSRSEGVVETTTTQLPKTNWFEIRPKRPLEPGEYALVLLPQRQDLFTATIFDFAIDPNAPANQSGDQEEWRQPE